MPSGITVVFFLLALFATFVSQATHVNAVLLYVLPIGLVFALFFAYGAIALKPVTVLLALAGLFWLLPHS